MKLRFIAVSAATLALATSLAACGSDETSGDSPSSSPSEPGSSAAPADFGDISVQLSWIKNAEFAGEFIASDAGYYSDAGFGDVKLLPGPVAQEQIVADGKAEFGLSNAISTASSIADAGFPLKIVGATYQKNPFSILSLSDKGNIQTPADMCGKKIGVQDPNLSLFNALVAANGLDCDITIVPNGFDISPLEDGEIDGLVAYATNESLLVAGDGFDTHDMLFADNGLPFVAETIITTDDMIANDRDKVKAFIYAEIKGWQAACDGEEGYKRGAELAVNVFGKDIDPPLELEKEIAQAKAQCEQLINTDETAEHGIFTISDDMIAANMKSIEASKIDISAEDLFDTSLVNEVYAEHPELLS